MSIFRFENYKTYLLHRIGAAPNRGRGEQKKIAQHIGVHTSLLSHILKGYKNLTPEQAIPLGRYFGLTGSEAEYFFELVNLERAGSEELRALIRARLARLKGEALGESDGQPEGTIHERDQAIFYSHWHYCAIHLLMMVAKSHSPEAIASQLKLPRQLVEQVIEFLISAGLLKEVKGKLKVASRRTHLPAGSSLATRHHMNWRVKGMGHLAQLSPEEFFYTSPMVIAKADAPRIQQIVREAIRKIDAIIEKSEPEIVVCLNLDWFQV